jgi:hypothetical protein
MFPHARDRVESVNNPSVPCLTTLAAVRRATRKMLHRPWRFRPSLFCYSEEKEEEEGEGGGGGGEKLRLISD